MTQTACGLPKEAWRNEARFSNFKVFEQIYKDCPIALIDFAKPEEYFLVRSGPEKMKRTSCYGSCEVCETLSMRQIESPEPTTKVLAPRTRQEAVNGCDSARPIGLM